MTKITDSFEDEGNPDCEEAPILTFNGEKSLEDDCRLLCESAKDRELTEENFNQQCVIDFSALFTFFMALSTFDEL